MISDAEQSHDAWLGQAIAAYALDGLSIEVNFRELVPTVRPGADRATHLIHPYPAKLLPAIPYLFLRCPSILPPGGRVLDPFCGSGTVLLEAALAGHSADGADANPLARIIAAAKLTVVGEAVLRRTLEDILAMPSADAAPPDVVNIAHWYHHDVIGPLAGLRAAVTAIGDPELRSFFEMCLSATARKVSLADPRLSVPVRINPDRLDIYGARGAEVVNRIATLTGDQVVPMFRAIAEQNIDRMARFREAAPAAAPPVLFDDARDLGTGDARYDLVITSPPYVGAQKYVRASSLGLGWLGFTPGGRLRELERRNIGREHYSKAEYSAPQETGCAAAEQVIARVREINGLRAHIASNYLIEMKAAFAETARVTRRDGWLVLISGQNLICGECFDTPAYLEAIARAAGFETRARLVDNIRSRGLMTKRNRTAGIISQEVITVMQKS
jgi:hypothetical protein